MPPHTEVAGAPPWLALIFALVADATLFTSLLFGTLYLWISAPNWPPAAAPEPNLLLALVALAALVVAAAAARGSLRSSPPAARRSGWIGLAALALLAAIAAIVVLIGGVVPHPREHALGATAAALLGYVALHAGIGILFLLSNFLRLAAGRISQRRTLDLRLSRLWLDYTAVAGRWRSASCSRCPPLWRCLGLGRERHRIPALARLPRRGLRGLVERARRPLRGPRHRLRIRLAGGPAARWACALCSSGI